MKKMTEDAFSLILQASVVVGSYSTSLLEATITGTLVVSYQPLIENIREDVFYERILMAKDYKSIIELISKATISPIISPARITYNPCKSLDFILNHIYSALNTA